MCNNYNCNKENRIAKFSKVSYVQFENDMKDTFPGITKSVILEIYKNICIPERATSGSAGYDFYSPINFQLSPGDTIKIPTGIRCLMDESWVLLLFPRSGLGFKYQMGMCNTIPVIDSDFYFSSNEGHIFIKFVNRGDQVININKNDRVAQGVFLPYGITEDDNVKNERNGGFGSTGK